MRKGPLQKLHMLVVLPLMLAVLLVSVCLPVACSAETMATGNCPDCASSATHSPMTMPMHTPVKHTDRPTTVPPCDHSAKVSVQASVTDGSQLRFVPTLATLPVLEAPAVSAPVLAHPVVVHSSPPPSLLLTASNLRI